MNLHVDKYVAFSVVNFFLVSFHILLIFTLLNGANPDGFLTCITVALSCALAVILVQYPLLVRARNWLLKFLIFFISMNVFMFMFGIFMGIVISDWADDGLNTLLQLPGYGLKMMVLGHLTGAIVGFFVVALVNFIMRKRFF